LAEIQLFEIQESEVAKKIDTLRKLHLKFVLHSLTLTKCTKKKQKKTSKLKLQNILMEHDLYLIS